MELDPKPSLNMSVWLSILFESLIHVYEWAKAFHLISVISWMAGLLYLPRLFVYHCDSEPGSRQAETFKVMERRLFNAIMTPAMIASWLFGLGMIHALGYGLDELSLWSIVKLLAVTGLTGVHAYLGMTVKRFASDQKVKSARFFRVINEVPTVLMIIIIFMVVLKPN